MHGPGAKSDQPNIDDNGANNSMDDEKKGPILFRILSFMVSPNTIFVIGLLLCMVNCVWLCCNCGCCNRIRKSKSGQQAYSKVSRTDQEENAIEVVEFVDH